MTDIIRVDAAKMHTRLGKDHVSHDAIAQLPRAQRRAMKPQDWFELGFTLGKNTTLRAMADAILITEESA
jgi:hypothetical protein